ncbi:MAG TPA: NADH-quinone oxidoreductase subunit NuoN [Magnetospirillaceae bacterium]|jgi:NADH-quinone oxidoreductase subunit N
MTSLPSLQPILPELIVAIGAIALLLFGVFQKKDTTRTVSWLAVLLLIVAGIVEHWGTTGRVETFGSQFVVDGFARFTKVLILFASAVCLAMATGWLRKEQAERIEFPVVTLFATLGMMMMVSANNLISLYLSLELQSLSLYVLAAYQRDNAKATEAGLKYFVLGSLASGMLLYGASLVYGFSGTTGFDALAHAFGNGIPVGVTVGMVFVLAGLAFKTSAVPFHMWTPDVYEGAPTPVTALFSVSPKVAALALLIRVMIEPFGALTHQWMQVVVVISGASMILGAFAAIVQTNIKRLMAYSSIGHVGYMLMAVATGTTEGVRGILIYLSIYLFMNLGTWAIIMAMRQRGRLVEKITDLAGLSKTHPGMALALAIFMFSMAGIPPLAGFWAKLYVFMAAIHGGLVILAVIGVLSSVVGAYYYLRIVKIMYFDEPAEQLDKGVGTSLTVVMTVAAIVIAVVTLIPSPLVNRAGAAAATLFGS